MAVVSLEVKARNILAGGKPFGEAGPYEQIRGKLNFAVDPKHPDHQVITDIGLAPTGKDGMVHFSADFLLLKPVNPVAGGRLLYDVVNRGNGVTVSSFNDVARGGASDEPDLGSGFLMRHGFTVAACGWQTDAPAGGMLLYAPEAMKDGAPLQGLTYIQYQVNRPAYSLQLLDRNHRSLPAADLSEAKATLTVREHFDAPATIIDRPLWQFARWEDGKAIPDRDYVCLPAGFQPGLVYELVYTTVGAPVIGLGFLAMRDSASFLKYGSAAQGNPCAETIQYAYSYGASQSGRFQREFLYLGLNAEEAGRTVFDGKLIHIASSRRGEFNLRYGQPSTNVLRAPGNSLPFTYTRQTDLITGESGGLLDRLAARNAVPKIIATNSGVEYWWSGASLTHMDVTGTQDVEPPADVRIYYFAGTQHGSGSLPLTDTTADGAKLKSPLNTTDYRPLQRAALLNLDRWVREGVEPPPSQHPRLADGTAVPREQLEGTFRSLPRVEFPKALPQRRRLDFGDEMTKGVPLYPAKDGEPYAMRVSAVDADGNEVAGVRSAHLRAPLATYTGWALRHKDSGPEGYIVPLQGATLVFPRSAQERIATGDPRLSIDERYSSREDYAAKVRAVCEDMVKEGLLLPEDVSNVVAQAEARYDAFKEYTR